MSDRPVYSTEHGRLCPTCGKPQPQCRCKTKTLAVQPGDGIVRVGQETTGRNGKGVTTVSGLSGDLATLKGWAQQLKQRCGCGGTLRLDGVIEIQGDHRDALVAWFQTQGMKVKRSGG